MTYKHSSPVDTTYGYHTRQSIDNVMDADTAALIAKLALEDLHEVVSERKGESPTADAPLSDAELALQLQSESFQDWLALSEDMKYAQRLNSALGTGRTYSEAVRPTGDRRAVKKLSRGKAFPLNPPRPPPPRPTAAPTHKSKQTGSIFYPKSLV